MLKLYRLPVILGISLAAAASAAAQAPRAFPFRATNYDVEVIVRPDDQTIQAQAKVDFVAEQVARTVLVELHPDLRLTSVKSSDGHDLTFARDNNSPLLLTVGLPGTLTPGRTVTITFAYGGPVSSEEDSPTKGLRFASIDKTSAYLLLPARWFPLTGYPSNRYTGTFNVIVPSTFAVAGTGKADPPTTRPGIGTAGAQTSYVFRCTQAAPVGSFVAGNLQFTNAPTEGYQFSFFTPPAQASTVSAYATLLGQIMNYLSDAFGPLGSAQPALTIAQIPDGTLAGYSAPGLLLVSSREWTTQANERMLTQLAAGQWWGSQVLPATPADVWVTDGLSRYTEAMYAEQSGGVASLNRALEDFAVGALMFEQTAPIIQADRIDAYSDRYRSIVDDKGAMVFHMLRAELGDDAFGSMLRDFYKQRAGKTASIDELEKLAAAKLPPPKKGEPPVNLLSFFSQWLNSTGVPEFSMDYITYRTPKGFQVIGKIRQELDTFRMPVEVKVETEGNPELKKILVTGTTTEFQIDTFGRPKPNGITIDPNNQLLKSSPKLRIRATIARGEALATLGRYYEAIQEYQRALDIQPTNSLAHFRTGEAMFYQKNYNSAANAFRAALGGDLDPKWVEVWSHIYMGKIYDLLGQRERAVNEYSLAQKTKDDTAGAQTEAARYYQKAYGAESSAPAATATASGNPAQATPPAGDAAANKEPTLKKRTDNN
ncbi:MAG TPA: tetratricopeptide repeat protein [Candidatus Acidoferrum sp.]|nr:tetratricopeptide repeat protein [Candidatus Acidoferrum sp.]